MRDTRDTTRRLLTVGIVVAILAAVAVAVVYPFSAARGSKSPAVADPPPRVLDVRPDVVRGRGAVKLVVHGRNFTSSTVVTIGGHTARVLAVRGPTSLVAVAPPGLGSEEVRAITNGVASAANARSVLHYRTRVLIVGDSLGIDLGWGFTAALDARDTIAVVDDAVGSSGLVRNDFYDWPRHLRADIASTHPDVVVTMFGTNDQQGLDTPGGYAEPGTAPWDRTYARRVRQIAAMVHRSSATLVWVSLPRMGPGSVLSPGFVAGVVKLDRDVLARQHRTAFVDAWTLFTDATGGYTPYVEISPRTWVLGHSPDGTHLTTGGAVAVDAKAIVLLRRLLQS